MRGFRVAILGRPNVGKSSLLNALLGFRRSIVLGEAGTTLDRITDTADWGTGSIALTDTHGVFGEKDDQFLKEVLSTIEACLFVVDASSGVTPFDRWIGNMILSSGIPTLLCVNKSEKREAEGVGHFSILGFENSVAISVVHRRGIDAIKEWIVQKQNSEGVNETTPLFTLCLAGRPNTGKSTLMNLLCQTGVSRISPIALTTRDPVGFDLLTSGGIIRLIDTAGMRRPRSRKEQVEVFAVHAATRMISRADVVFLLISTIEPLTDQDQRLLSLLEREGRPTLVLLNFWDRLSQAQRKEFLEDSKEYLRNFETLPISALTGWNTGDLLTIATRLQAKAKKRVKTSDLNRIVERLVAKNPPPSRGRQNFNILYASQVKSDPPTFVFFMNRKENLPDSYKSYLENQLRKELHLKSQPIRVFFRAKI